MRRLYPLFSAQSIIISAKIAEFIFRILRKGEHSVTKTLDHILFKRAQDYVIDDEDISRPGNIQRE